MIKFPAPAHVLFIFFLVPSLPGISKCDENRNFETRTKQVSSKIFIGPSPESRADFEFLKSQNVSSIISVDGAQPRLELAGGFDIKYAHVPIGYDGIKRKHLLKIAKVYQGVEEKLFIHCHKGHHRGPAAAACLLVAAEEISKENGLKLMKRAGTSTEYKGLYSAILSATAITQKELSNTAMPPAFRKPSDRIQSMKLMEKHLENLDEFNKNGFNPISNKPDLSLEHESLLLHQAYKEFSRIKEEQTAKKDGNIHYSRLIKNGIRLTKKLYDSVRVSENGEEIELSQSPREILESIKNNCSQCHKKFRN